jgi:uncharacterized protein (DUF952 family)
MFIYHIVLPEVWEEIKTTPLYSAPSLFAEGFIHCSYENQIDGVLGRYYSDHSTVVILTIDADLLGSRLVAEPSTNDEVYPHIYGPINLHSVVDTETREI